MAVTSAALKSVTGVEDKDGYMTYTHVWQVLTDSRYDGPKTVLTYSGLPQRTTTHLIPGGTETDPTAACVSRTPKYKGEEQSLCVWHVDIVYSNNPAASSQQDNEDPPGNPWDEPPVVDCYAVKSKKAVLYDLNKRLIASSAGEPYDPVQEKDETKYMLRTVRNQLSITPVFNSTFKDAINGDVFAGFPKHTVKCETPGIFTRKYHGGVKYYQVTWEFAVEPRTWKLKLVDFGMMHVVNLEDGAGAFIGRELRPIKVDGKTALTAPRLLNGAGGVLQFGFPPVESGDVPGWDPYDLYEEKFFGAIGLTEFLNI